MSVYCSVIEQQIVRKGKIPTYIMQVCMRVYISRLILFQKTNGFLHFAYIFAVLIKNLLCVCDFFFLFH